MAQGIAQSFMNQSIEENDEQQMEEIKITYNLEINDDDLKHYKSRFKKVVYEDYDTSKNLKLSS